MISNGHLDLDFCKKAPGIHRFNDDKHNSLKLFLVNYTAAESDQNNKTYTAILKFSRKTSKMKMILYKSS